MLSHKNIKIFIKYFLGPLLFLWLLFSIVRQVRQQAHLEASWLHIKAAFGSVQVGYLLAAVLLIFFNWGLEARKWQLSIATVVAVPFLQAFKAVLSGVSFSVTTPNRTGEYLGRMLYLPDGSRLKSISVTLVGSISQLLVTVVTGFFALLLLQQQLLASGLVSMLGYRFLLLAVLGGAVLLALLYFETGVIGALLNRWLQRSRFRYLIQALQDFHNPLLWRLLLLSALRYAVFVLQYLLLFRFFGVTVPLTASVPAVALLFLAMAVIPSISLLEVGLRGEISLTLMGWFTGNSLGVGFTSVTIWLLNLVLPAVAGSVLILGVRLSNKKNNAV